MGSSRFRWRMPETCVDCPFNADGPGATLAASLRPGRMAELKRGLLRGQHFLCHKTTAETGDGSRLVCAGALRFQDEHGVSSNYVRVCERLEYSASQQEA